MRVKTDRPASYLDVGHYGGNVNLWGFLHGRLHATKANNGFEEIDGQHFTHDYWEDRAFNGERFDAWGRIDHDVKIITFSGRPGLTQRQAKYILDRLCRLPEDYAIHVTTWSIRDTVNSVL